MTTNYDVALSRAIDRDLRDEERLDHCAALVSDLLDALIPEMHDMEHPKRKWSPLDLGECLREQLACIEAEREHLRGAVFVDEDFQ